MLRSAGLPTSDLDPITDPEIAHQADRHNNHETSPEDYEKAFTEAEHRLTRATATLAQHPTLRSAIAWQNPRLLPTALDRIDPGNPRNSKTRERERTLSAYLQRYTHKNDTIGFHGPAAWTRFHPDRPFTSTPGPHLVREYRTYFENWAIDQIATTLAERPDIRPWLTPRPVKANSLHGHTLHLPRRPPLTLTPAQHTLLTHCDGRTTVTDLLARTPGTRLDDLEQLHALGAIHLDLIGPIEAHPEKTLRDKLTRIGDPTTREQAIATLDTLDQARERLHHARTADQILDATSDLADRFIRITGTPATRRHGQTYAGRTLAFQDTIRDIDLTLGAPVLNAMAPLPLLLHSAQWLTARAADHYRDLFDHLFDTETRRRGTTELKLTYLISRTTSDLTAINGQLPPPVARAQKEFQQRWKTILDPPTDQRHQQINSDDITREVHHHFPELPLPWSTAAQHSPDMMIAAADPTAINHQDFHLVLGELHLTR
ncbi:lantibiotic dehydratase, partial [Nocardiopsis alba]|uniref:lantibiotic dehydratase n=1 Tax=Nocardiopsis alba TaxID=53437 RepID=UPI0037FD1ACF